MKGKTLLSLAIVLSMILALTPFVAIKSAGAASPLTMSLIFTSGTTPTGTNMSSAPKGTNFVVECNIANIPAPGIDDFSVGITWNASMVELQHNNVSEDILQPATGPFSAVGGWSFANVASDEVFLNDTDGVPVNTALLGGISGDKPSGETTGNGTLFTMDFTCIGVGISDINITAVNGLYTFLYFDFVTAVNIDAGYNAQITQIAPPSQSPTAIISKPLNGATFTAPAPISLNGSTSTVGYDSITKQHPPITEYLWTIVNSSGTFHLTGATNSTTAGVPGTVTISLEVVAPPSDPPAGYVDNNTETIEVFVVPPVTGPKIDVYTGYPLGENGQNQYLPSSFPYPYGWSESYGPQELVCVWANVTYNGAPVWYKPVEFVVYGAGAYGGSEIASYEAFTNESGLAKVCFRIPWQANNGTSYFGNMSITGTVSISQVQVNDTVKFYYGWVLEINSVMITPTYPTPVHREENPLGKTPTYLTVNVTICSYMVYQTIPFYLEVTAVDVAGVPFGQYKVYNDTLSPAKSIHMVGTIDVPVWAYVGTGTLYVDLLNSTATGVPYCPEATAPFAITYP